MHLLAFLSCRRCPYLHRSLRKARLTFLRSTIKRHCPFCFLGIRKHGEIQWITSAAVAVLMAPLSIYCCFSASQAARSAGVLKRRVLLLNLGRACWKGSRAPCSMMLSTDAGAPAARQFGNKLRSCSCKLMLHWVGVVGMFRATWAAAAVALCQHHHLLAWAAAAAAAGRGSSRPCPCSSGRCQTPSG